jgi:hypothetical protein
MKLEGMPVQPEKQDIFKLKPQSSATEQINLHLTLQFNEQRERLLSGRIKFGLKGGELSVKLENGTIPLASGELGGTTDKFQFTSCQVTTKNSQENPVWVFEVERGQPVLKGLVKNALLATMTVTAKPCCVEATFEVSPRDVYVTEAEGLWPQNISKKRRAVIERAIARRFLERKLKPYVSRQELRYD